MTRISWTLGSLLLLALLAPAPAHAAAAPAPVQVLAGLCPDGYLDGKTIAVAEDDRGLHGFATFRYSEACGDRIHHFSGSGTTWSAAATSLVGTVVSAAADSTGAYLLYARAGARQGAPELAVAKRSPNGVLTELAVLGTTAPAVLDRVGAAIVARDGGWYAVWPKVDRAKNQHELHHAGTLFGASRAPRRIPASVVGDSAPALAVTPGTKEVQLAWTRTIDETTTIYLARTMNGNGWSTRTLATAVPLSSGSPRVDLAVNGRHIAVAWTETTGAGDRVVVADNLSGSFVRRQPPALEEFGSWDPRVAINATAVVAGYSTGDEFPGVAYAAIRGGTTPTWTVLDPNPGIPSSIDTYGVAGVAIHGTTVTSLVYSGGQLFAVNGGSLR